MHLKNAALTLILASSAMAADAPYVGKWKLNADKSDYASTTLTYTQLPGGEMQCTVDAQSYKFKMDGKDYPDPFGDIAAWKAIDANTWETTWKTNGKVISTDTVKLSSDGKTLTVESTGTKPNGDKMDDTTVFRRLSGGPGLAGQWKTEKVSSATPSLIEFVPGAGDALTFKMSDMELTCDGKFDGKEHSCTGPTMTPGWTFTYARNGASGVDLAIMKDGKPLYKYTYRASADGKTLTQTGGSIESREIVKMVYDRQ